MTQISIINGECPHCGLPPAKHQTIPAAPDYFVVQVHYDIHDRAKVEFEKQPVVAWAICPEFGRPKPVTFGGITATYFGTPILSPDGQVFVEDEPTFPTFAEFEKVRRSQSKDFMFKTTADILANVAE